jgi:hypothetical protein
VALEEIEAASRPISVPSVRSVEVSAVIVMEPP